MDLDNDTGTQARFAEYTASLASELGHADRVRRFADYCIGLLSAEGRKSVEPLAAVTAPERTAAQHQSLLHFVAQAPWSGCTYPRSGPTIRLGGQSPACQMRSASRPSRRSPCSSCARRWRMVCRRA